MEHDAGQRLWHFHGGIDLAHHKHLSTRAPIAKARLPAALVVALDQHLGAPAEPLVEAGETVLKGQPIGASSEQLTAPVHAPSSGIVRSIDAHPVPGRDTTARCIVIDTDGAERWIEHEGIKDYSALNPDQIRERVFDAGIVGLGGAAFPTHIKLTPTRLAIETLIINGAECEPYIACDEMLMRERAESIIRGARIMQHALQCRSIVVAVEDERKAAITALTEAIRADGGADLKLRSVPSIYPEGGEKQLIQMLTGLEVPSGGLPQHLGLVCHNVHTAAAVDDAITHGRPLISRIVTVTGHGIKEPRNYEALIGTPISDLIRQAGGYTRDMARLVMGGPLMGTTIADDRAPVIKATNCVLALTKDEIVKPQPQMPCIRCMECVRVCPAQLLPQQLYWHIEAHEVETTQALGLADCIECGCCAAVCPSQIPLVDYYRAAKQTIRENAIAKARAEHAKVRFEAREERLQRQKHAREAQLQARKQAVKRHGGEEIQAAIERARQKSKH